MTANQVNSGLWALLLFGVLSMPLAAAPTEGEPAIYMLPLNCAELLPDQSQFSGFFNTVAQGIVANDKQTARRMLRILALRDKLAESGTSAREENPIDVLIRKTLCFYREQKEPLKPISYEDSDFVRFLKASLKELETKSEDAVFLVELERAQRRQFEAELERNQGKLESLSRQAQKEADESYERLARSARRKVKTP